MRFRARRQVDSRFHGDDELCRQPPQQKTVAISPLPACFPLGLSCPRKKLAIPFATGYILASNRASRRWSMKAYCKHCELKAHQCKLEPVIEYAEGLLRVELTLRGQELRQYDTLSNDIIWEYYRRLSMSKQTSTTDDLMIDQLGRPAQNTYYRWRDGLDMKTRLPSNTYYRHRREIYKALGVDISAPYSPPSDDSITDDFSQAKLESVQEPNRPQSLVDQSLLLDL